VTDGAPAGGRAMAGGCAVGGCAAGGNGAVGGGGAVSGAVGRVTGMAVSATDIGFDSLV